MSIEKPSSDTVPNTKVIPKISSEEIAIQMAEYEAKGGKIKTAPDKLTIEDQIKMIRASGSMTANVRKNEIQKLTRQKQNFTI